MPVSIETVTTKSQLKEFVKLPFRLYRADPNWVPALLIDDYKKLDPKRNPFFEHAETTSLVARRDGRAVGRIMAIVDRLWEETHGEKAAYWGWFECENDPEAAKALFAAAESWARERKCTRIIGPMSPSANDLVGLLIKGFDGPPQILMPYNPPYYADLAEGHGYRKWKDLVAWLLDNPEIPERLARVMPKIEARGKFRIRTINMKRFREEVDIFKLLYNEFEKVNAIFTPMTDGEIAYMASDLKMGIDPDIVFMAEVDGKPVGASLAVPNFNLAYRAAYGRLLPFGIFKMLLAKRKIHRIRVISLGVLKEYRNRGIDLAFYYYSYKNGVPKGYDSAEMSWVEEDNVEMTNSAVKLGGKPYRSYRVYERAL
jgi:GNAT superfamily N-acetyltransferase